MKIQIKTFVFTIACLLSMSCAVSVMAAPMETNANEIYMEKGEIDLDGLSLNSDEKKLVIQKSGENQLINERKGKLEKELKQNIELKKTLIRDITQGKTVKAIGYSSIYVKDIKDKNGEVHQEPMTNYEFRSLMSNARGSGTGSSSTRGKLTLYTVASITYRSGNRYIGTSTVATWGYTFMGTAENNANSTGMDFITCTVPSKYTITNSFMEAYNSNGASTQLKYYKVQDWKTTVVNEFETRASTKYVLKADGRAADSVAREYIKVSSQYLHTWTTANVSVGLTSAGVVSFSLSQSNKSWQLASSVSFQE